MVTKKFTIFISWSKSPSREIAKSMQLFLEKTCPEPDISFFVSSSQVHGIKPGEKFNKVLDDKLENSDFGIIILTKNNYSQQWCNRKITMQHFRNLGVQQNRKQECNSLIE